MTASSGIPPSPGADATADADQQSGGSAHPWGASRSAGMLPPEPMLPPAPFQPPAPMLPPEPMLAPSPMLPPAPFQLPAPALAPRPATPQNALPPGPPPAPSAPRAARPAPARGLRRQARSEAMPTVRSAGVSGRGYRIRPPGRSRRGVKLVLLVAGAGVTILVVPVLRTALTAPGTAVQHSASTPAAGPSASALGTGAAAPPAPVSLSRAQRWLEGLAVLRLRMENALAPGVITRSSLRRTAATLDRCTPGLAALGQPPSRLRPEYRLARRACADFEQGARFAAAAARAFTTTGPDRKLNKLLDQTDTAVNHGTYLIDNTAIGDPGVPPGN